MSPEPLVMLKEAAGGSLGLKVAECQVDLEVSGNPNMRMCILFVTCALSTVFLVYNLLKLHHHPFPHLVCHPTSSNTYIHTRPHTPAHPFPITVYFQLPLQMHLVQMCLRLLCSKPSMCLCIYTTLRRGILKPKKMIR